MDSRATEEIGDYVCFECCDTLEEAKESAPEYGAGCCIWECDIQPNNENAGTLINEKLIAIL